MLDAAKDKPPVYVQKVPSVCMCILCVRCVRAPRYTLGVCVCVWCVHLCVCVCKKIEGTFDALQVEAILS